MFRNPKLGLTVTLWSKDIFKNKTSQVRSDKAEEEVAELMKKAEQLEVELDKTKEELVNNMILQLGRIMMMERSGLSAGDLFGIRMVCGVVKWWLQDVVVTSKV